MSKRQFVIWMLTCFLLWVLAVTVTYAHETDAGKGSLTGTATWKTRGLFGIWFVKTKTCSGHPVWMIPHERWSTAALNGLYNGGSRHRDLEERYERERTEVICRHDGSFRFDGLEAGRSYYVVTLVRWKTPNLGIVQGGWLFKYVDVPSSVPVHVAL